jgi:hypothetical protein
MLLMHEFPFVTLSGFVILTTELVSLLFASNLADDGMSHFAYRVMFELIVKVPEPAE